MTELRLFWLDLLTRLRQAGHGPSNTFSGLIVLLIALVFVSVTVWTVPISADRSVIPLVLYGVALLEIALGLRVGFLRVGSRADEYFLPISVRFWRRSLPYVLPALLLPLPVMIALAKASGGGWVDELGLLAALKTNYILFFASAVAWAAVIRRITRQPFARLAIVGLSLLGVLVMLSSGSFPFQAVLIAYSQGGNALAWLILAQTAAIAASLLISEPAISTLALGLKRVGQYWQVFLGLSPLGFGQGSSSFFAANRLMLRSSALHRRISALVAGSLVLTALAYLLLALGGVIVTVGLPLLAASLFGAASATVLAKLLSESAIRRLDDNRFLPLQRERISAGFWIAGALWQIIVSFIIWGLSASYLPLGTDTLGPLLIAALTQYALLYGWSAKLAQARHQTAATIVVFLMAALVGTLPLLLATVTSLAITLLIQLLWFAFIVILLQLTRLRTREVQYG